MFVTANIILALNYPNLVSCGFFILSHTILFTSFFKPKSRIIYGWIFHTINFLALLVLIGWKVKILKKAGEKEIAFKDVEAYTDATEELTSTGFNFTPVEGK